MHPIVAPQLRGGLQHNYSTKTRQAGRANKQYILSFMFMGKVNFGLDVRVMHNVVRFIVQGSLAEGVGLVLLTSLY